MNLRLFVHIMLDGYLSGSDLEGISFAETCQALHTYVHELTEVPSNLEQILQSTVSLTDIEAKLSEIASLAQLDELAGLIQTKIIDLTPGCVCMIPGGWATHPSGHRMIYQFQRTSAGFEFYVYNSGAGICYHPKIFNQSKGVDVYQNHIGFCFPSNPDVNLLKAFIFKLLLPRFPNFWKRYYEAMSAEVIYKSVIESIFFLGGVTRISNTLTKPTAYTSGQLSGTCAQTVLYQVVKNSFDDLKAYQQFVYGYKIHTLSHYIATVQASSASRQQLQAIQYACQSMLRFLSDNSIFSEPQQAVEVKKLLDFSQLEFTPTALGARGGKKPIRSFKLYLDTEQVESKQEIIVPSFTQELILPSLADGLEALELLVKNSQVCLEQQNFSLVYTKLETFILQLPISAAQINEFIHLVGKEHKQELIDTFIQIYDCYHQAIDKWLGIKNPIIPRVIICDLILFNFIQKTCFQLKLPSDVISNFIHMWLTIIDHHPYFVTHSLELTEKLSEIIVNQPKKEKDIPRNIYLHHDFHQLLEDKPQLKDILRKAYTPPLDRDEAREIRKQNHQAVFEFLYNLRKYEEDPRFQKLTQELNLLVSLYKKLEQFTFADTQLNTFHYRPYYASDICLKPKSIIKRIQAQRYRFESPESPIALALLPVMNAPGGWPFQPHRNAENVIQIENTNPLYFFWHQSEAIHHQPSKTESIARDLNHLRTAPRLQSILTMEYFSKHLDLLEQRDYQQFIEANLFEPLQLLELLKKHQDFLGIFNAFIDKGTRYLRDPHEPLTLPQLFLLKLKVLMYCYVCQMGTKVEEELAELQAKVSEYLTDKSLLPPIMIESLLFLQAKIAWVRSSISDEEKLTAILPYYFVGSSAHSYYGDLYGKPDLTTMLDQKLFALNCKTWILERTHLVTLAQINLVLFLLDHAPCESFVSKDGVTIALDHGLMLDMQQGMIFNVTGAIAAKLPQALLNFPMLQPLVGTLPCFAHLTEQGMLYALGSPAELRIYPSQNYKVIFFDALQDLFTIEKKWKLSESSDWYRFVRERNRVSQDIFEGVSFSRKKYSLWQSMSAPRPYFLVSNKTSLEYQIIQNDRHKWCWVKIENNLPTEWLLVLNETSMFHELCANFESPFYQNVYLNSAKDRCLIELYRYGLTIKGQLENGEWAFFNADDQSFQLCPGGFYPGLDGLFFENKGKLWIYLAILPYMKADASEDSLFYHLSPDQRKKTTAAKKISDWGYYRYALVDGHPVAESVVAALYLVYVFLACDNYDDAWQVLQDIEQRLGGLSGQPEESIFIDWILHALPATEEKKDCEQISNPAVIACQLKLLDLFAGAQPFASSKTIEIASIIEQKFERYQKQTRFRAHTFSLNFASILNLISYMHAHGIDSHLPYVLPTSLTPEMQILSSSILYRPRNTVKVQQQQLSVITARMLNTAARYQRPPREIGEDRNDIAFYGYPEFNPQAISMISSPLSLAKYFSQFLSIVLTRKDIADWSSLEKYCQQFLLLQYGIENDLDYWGQIAAYVLMQIAASGHTKASLKALSEKEISSWFERGLKQRPMRIESQAFVEASDHFPSLISGPRDARTTSIMLHEPPSIPSACLSIIDSLEQTDAERFAALSAEFFTGSRGIALDTLEAEFKAGELEYRTLLEMRAIASRFDFDQDFIDTEVTRMRQMQAQNLTDVIAFASQHRALFAHEIAAKLRQDVDLEHLIACYLAGNIEQYAQLTKLNQADIIALDQMMMRYLLQSIQVHQLQRIRQKLEKLALEPENLVQKYLVAQELFAKNRVDVAKDRAMTVLQYRAQILLREDQLNLLTRMRSASAERVEQMIMGGGKTKVILPILAKLKADEGHLVVIVVPKDLVETNFNDLTATSAVTFQQKAYRFAFERHYDCSISNLQRLYEHLLQVKATKGYLICAEDAIPILFSKYLEMVYAEETVEKQIQIFDKILACFTEDAYVHMDEVDMVLWSKKKLNFSFGQAESSPLEVIEASIALYRFLSHVHLGEHVASDLIQYSGIFTADAQWQEFSATLAHALMHDSHSPLNRLTATWTLEEKKAVAQYFLNQTTAIPEVIKQLSLESKNVFASYKQQLSGNLGVGILAQTLRAKLFEHYGPSAKTDIAVVEKNICIPYFSNQKPNERSRFANAQETINYCIQMLSQQGLDFALFEYFIKSLQQDAKQAIINFPNDYREIRQTPQALQFERRYGHRLDKINFKREDIGEIYEKFRYHPLMIDEVLQSYILPAIKTESAVIHSDPFHHVEMYRHVQGFTGTPWNHLTYHRRLKFNASETVASDGFILKLLQAKDTKILRRDFQDSTSLLEQLFPCAKTTRVIIDTCAAFNGIDNEAIAKQIAARVEGDIQYVLFFNHQNQLSALSVQDPSHVLLLASSDPDMINQRLGCEPNQRFTYYDQSHSIGVDLQQDKLANGLVLVDQNTYLRNFLQGSMRMRGLSASQTIDIVIPSSMEIDTYDALIAYMDKTQKTALKKDIYLSAFPKMLNEIRVRVSRDGRNIENLTDKRAYFAIFRDLFIDIKSQDYFSLYGQPSLFRSTEEILTSHATRLKQLWQERHQLLGLALSEEKLQLLDHDLKTIIRDTMKYVDEVYLSDNSERFGEQVQVKVEQLTQIELQVQQVIEVSEQKLRAVDYVPWKSLPQRNANKVLRLNAFLAEDKLDFGPIYLSQNFYRCFEQQKPEIDEYLKPVFVLMFRQTRPHVFEAFLLTQQEAHELEPMIAKNSGVWLTTTNHSVLAGQAPPGIQQSKLYQSMMEVAQFINADLSLLLAHTGEFSWLDREKIKFFRERLQTIRIADDAMLQTLEQKLEHQDLRTPFHSLQAPLSASWFIAACAGMAGIVGGALLVVGLISSQEILLALGIVCMAFSSVYLALTMFKPKEQHKFEAPCVSIQLFKDR